MAEAGVYNVCLRELRFVLEASIKLCYIQQKDPQAAVQAKIAAFSKVLDSPSISLKKDLALSLLPDDVTAAFLNETGRVYGETSNYVHFTS